MLRVCSITRCLKGILSSNSLDRSAYSQLVSKIKFLMIGRVFIPQKIRRARNRVANCLARYSRFERATAVWLGSAPPCIEDIWPLDCNSIHT